MAEITIKCVEGNPLAINVVMTAIEHSMLNGEMVTETVDFYPDTTKPVRAVLDCTTARRQYCPQTSVTDNVVYVSDNGSIAAGVYTLTITCTDTQGKKRRYKSDPCIEVYDATSAAEIAATFDAQTYELNGVFYTFAGGGGTVQADWNETDPNNPSYILNKPDLSEYATDEELQDVEESIPDVPAWALQPQKPAYTAGEVGAVPTTRTVNGKALSQDITLDADDVGAQPTIPDLGEIRNGAEAGATAYQKPSTGIPKSDLANEVQQSLNKANTALQPSDLTPIENDIDAIEAKIPSAASSSNQLADKAFVNSSIATNTSTFKGTYNSLAELQAVTGATNNDYGFVIEYDEQGNEYYDRYKFNGTAWVFEYKIESTPFTAAQWAAIQSGITSGDVAKLAALPTKAQLDALLDAKQDTINDLASIRTGAGKGATAYQKPSGGIPKSDLATAVQASLNKADTALQSYTESDPVFSASPAAHITNEDITSWNDKSDFSGSYNDLSDKPTIPAAQVQSDWNQTNKSAKDYIKNKPTIPHGVVVDNALSSTSENPVQNKVINNALNGKQSTINDLATIRSGASAGATAYQKPSGGIPKSDLATAVQTSLNKADSALQSYTESDPVFTSSPAHGITASDITNWNGKASKVAIVNHGTSDTTFTLTPNIFHVWGTVASLTLTLATASTTTMDEFMFQFTSGTTATTLSLPSTVKWVAEPKIEAGMTYQVSIVNNIAVIGGVS